LEKDVKQALKDSGLDLVDALSYYVRPNFSLDHMKPSLDWVKDCGFEYALAICDDEDWGRQVANFKALSDYCESINLKVSMEAPVTQNAVNTLEKAVKVIEESGTKNAYICLDPMHYWRTGGPPEGLDKYPRSLIPYTQIRDGSPTSGPGADPK